jgi:hypothetical protein
VKWISFATKTGASVRTARRILGVLAGVIAGLYLLSLLAFCVFQRSFLYFPSDTYVTLRDARANESFKEISVRTADGLDLKA